MSGFNNRIPLLSILCILILHQVEVCYGASPESQPIAEAEAKENGSGEITKAPQPAEEITTGSDQTLKAPTPVAEEITTGSDQTPKAPTPVAEEITTGSDQTPQAPTPVAEEITTGSDQTPKAPQPVAEEVTNGSDETAIASPPEEVGKGSNEIANAAAPEADETTTGSDIITPTASVPVTEEITNGSAENAIAPQPEEVGQGSPAAADQIQNGSDETAIAQPPGQGFHEIPNAAPPAADEIKNGSDETTKAPPPVAEVKSGARPSLPIPKTDCKGLCFTKCKEVEKFKMCIRTCNTCCQRCDCVRSAEQPCPCWDTIVHKGRKRCP